MAQLLERSLDENFALALAGYRHELKTLISVVRSPYFKKLLPKFLNNEKFVALQRDASYADVIKQGALVNGCRTLKDVGGSRLGNELFSCVNLAAACGFFQGWTIPVTELNANLLDAYVSQTTQTQADGKERLGREIANRLSVVDAVRVTYLLKLLGLLRWDSHVCHQLSLGSLDGQKDRQYMHQQPFVRRADPSRKKKSPLSFGVLPHTAKHIVLVDSDPRIEQMYLQFNQQQKDQVLALNEDIYSALEKLARAVNEGRLQPRELITIFRLDHTMLPEPERFIHLLGQVAGRDARLIITIGSGDNEDEFQGRMRLLDELQEGLVGRQLEPLRVGLCAGGSIEEKRNNPAFGMPHYASHEVLSCRLGR